VGINSIMLAWLDRLADRGVFAGFESIFELGPQDLFVPRAQIEYSARRRMPSGEAAAAVEEILRPSPDTTHTQQWFYRTFGFGEYEACDAIDKRAHYKIDLNFAAPELGPYDCITNFGTTEHVFNIGAAFASVHKLLKEGGLALHVLPACGDVNHGFYNIHPTAYADVAAANHYELVDLLYIDNMNLRCLRQAANFTQDQLSGLPIDLSADWSQIALSRRISELYAQNVAAPDTRAMLDADANAYVVDYCFAAMRKPVDSGDFIMPMQRSSAGWIHSGK